MVFRRTPRDERFQRLASRIEELRRKDEQQQQFRRRIIEGRNNGVRRLWEICGNFANTLNSFAKEDRLDMTPAEPPEVINEDEQIQLMLNVRGRILLLDLAVPNNLLGKENFKKPYILEGDVRFFNQELLENEQVEEHNIFFCPDEGRDGAWMYWNGRTYKSGVVDEDYLAGLLEQIL